MEDVMLRPRRSSGSRARYAIRILPVNGDESRIVEMLSVPREDELIELFDAQGPVRYAVFRVIWTPGDHDAEVTLEVGPIRR